MSAGSCDHLEAVTIRNAKTGATRDVDTSALFIMVGDIRAGSVKRVASPVGEGSVVISKVWEFVNRKG
jgi:thioredoxin reductase (NADPH)